MKKLLLASTALVMTAGVAAADVRVGGDGRMGIIKDLGADDISFTSRIRISFAASGETDGGLTFGGSIRADNAGNGSGSLPQGQTAGSVFISGAFGRLTMGDVSGAAEAAVGDVSGVGMTNLRDTNEAFYISNATSGQRSAMRYDYTTGAFGFHISADNPTGPTDIYSVAVSYNAGAFRGGIGFESGTIDSGTAFATDLLGVAALPGDLDVQHIILGGSATFGDATVKAQYGTADVELGGADDTLTQYALSLDYKIDALTLTAFYRNIALDDADVSVDAYGVGAAYSLGGGATLRGGYVQVDDGSDTEDAFDFGLVMSF